MPALQSFSLPRSGPRVTARPCPPVVLRQRRRDYEALFRSEIRDSVGSWPTRAARCSPGLPHLEPHPTDVVQARADRVACSAIGCHRRPKASTTHDARGRAFGSDITVAPRFPGILPVYAVTEVTSSPVRSPVMTVVIPSRPRGAPRDRRKPARTTRPRARAPQQHPRCPRLPCATWLRPPRRSTPSAQPRTVRSAAAVEGVHVVDGLIRSRSVARGRVIRA
jgi:hypothetical protein